MAVSPSPPSSGGFYSYWLYFLLCSSRRGSLRVPFFPQPRLRSLHSAAPLGRKRPPTASQQKPRNEVHSEPTTAPGDGQCGRPASVSPRWAGPCKHPREAVQRHLEAAVGRVLPAPALPADARPGPGEVGTSAPSTGEAPRARRLKAHSGQAGRRSSLLQMARALSCSYPAPRQPSRAEKLGGQGLSCPEIASVTPTRGQAGGRALPPPYLSGSLVTLCAGK